MWLRVGLITSLIVVLMGLFCFFMWMTLGSEDDGKTRINKTLSSLSEISQTIEYLDKIGTIKSLSVESKEKGYSFYASLEERISLEDGKTVYQVQEEIKPILIITMIFTTIFGFLFSFWIVFSSWEYRYQRLLKKRK